MPHAAGGTPTAKPRMRPKQENGLILAESRAKPRWISRSQTKYGRLADLLLPGHLWNAALRPARSIEDKASTGTLDPQALEGTSDVPRMAAAGVEMMRCATIRALGTSVEPQSPRGNFELAGVR